MKTPKDFRTSFQRQFDETRRAIEIREAGNTASTDWITQNRARISNTTQPAVASVKRLKVVGG